MTFELGRIMTWRLPAFSALLMLLRQSLRTLSRSVKIDYKITRVPYEVLTILAVVDDSQGRRLEVSVVEISRRIDRIFEIS